MDAILSIAARYDLLVIEDACQAHGAEYRSADGIWRRAGTFGKAAAFSFYPGKNLGACGEAGAVTTDDEQVAKTIRMLREHGQAKKYYHDLEGYNGRLDAIQAAFLRVKLRHLDDWNAQRRAAAARYGELLSGVTEVSPPFEPERSRAVYHLYVIRNNDRDALAAAPEVARRFDRFALPAARPSAEVLPRLGLRCGQPAGDRARGIRDSVAADVSWADGFCTAACGVGACRALSHRRTFVSLT